MTARTSRPRIVAALATLAALAFAPAAGADDAELITVTPDTAIATWVTSQPGDTTICVDDRPCATEEQGVTYHYASVEGLKPSTLHHYTLRTNGVDEPLSITNPDQFTTLTPPPGKRLFQFAVMNDLHVGEGCAGTAFNAPLIGNSVPPCFSAPDYAARMDQAQIDEIAKRGIDLTLIGGDVTAEARPADMAHVKSLLDRLPGTVLVARGNHDRVHPENPCGTDHDCFRTTFYPDRAPGRTYAAISRHGYHFIALDSVQGSSTGDLTDAGQNAWLAHDLAAHRQEPTFIIFHHPVSVYADTFQEEPVVFGVPPNAGGSQFLQTVADNPQIVGVLQAHTHRNFNSYGDNDTTPFIENGTSKEYPGGYSVFTVYEGGYTRSYFRPSTCEFCREWTQTTRGEYFGLAAQYLLGSLGTRNFTHVYGCDATIPPASLPGDESLLSGAIVTPPAQCLGHVSAAGTLGPDEGGGLGASFTLLTRLARLARGSRSGLLRLACANTVACGVTGTVVTTKRHHTLTLARARGTVRGGATGRLRLTLTARGQRALRARPRVRARARLSVQVAAGDIRHVSGRLTLLR